METETEYDQTLFGRYELLTQRGSITGMLTFNRHHKPDAIESLIYDNRDIEFSIGWSDQLYSIQVTGVTHLINGNRVQLTFVVNSMFGDTVLKLVRRICMELPIIVRRENDRLSADRLKCVGREYPGAG